MIIDKLKNIQAPKLSISTKEMAKLKKEVKELIKGQV